MHRQISRNSGPEFGRYFNNIGSVYEAKGDYDLALNHYGKSLDIYEKLYKSDHPSLALALHNISRTYKAKGDKANVS
jgi:tetratricopeptide (TPR) repeat protein